MKLYAYNHCVDTIVEVKTILDIFKTLVYMGTDDTDAQDVILIVANKRPRLVQGRALFNGNDVKYDLDAHIYGYSYSRRDSSGLIQAFEEMIADRFIYRLEVE